jgi:hypothetical protein
MSIREHREKNVRELVRTLGVKSVAVIVLTAHIFAEMRCDFFAVVPEWSPVPHIVAEVLTSLAGCILPVYVHSHVVSLSFVFRLNASADPRFGGPVLTDLLYGL